MSVPEIFKHHDFRRLQAARFLSTLGTQIASVCVGWQVYALTHRKLDLGYVGLAQFFPALALPLVTGVVADRFDRRRVVALCHFASALCFVALFAIAASRVSTPAPIYAVLVALGVARAFMGPASQALLPNVVPASALPERRCLGSRRCGRSRRSPVPR
ncbi:MAG: MFS transporter [Polyangiales bacterium]